MNSTLKSIKGFFDEAVRLKSYTITFEPEHEWASGGDIHHGVHVLADGIRVGYERSWFPWNIFKEPMHWCISSHVFYDEAEGKAAAEVFGGRLVGDPYDDAAWGLEFVGEDRYERLAAYYHFFESKQTTTAVKEAAQL